MLPPTATTRPLLSRKRMQKDHLGLDSAISSSAILQRTSDLTLLLAGGWLNMILPVLFENRVPRFWHSNFGLARIFPDLCKVHAAKQHVVVGEALNSAAWRTTTDGSVDRSVEHRGAHPKCQRSGRCETSKIHVAEFTSFSATPCNSYSSQKLDAHS